MSKVGWNLWDVLMEGMRGGREIIRMTPETLDS